MRGALGKGYLGSEVQALFVCLLYTTKVLHFNVVKFVQFLSFEILMSYLKSHHCLTQGQENLSLCFLLRVVYF